jgi:hypothetical protein
MTPAQDLATVVAIIPAAKRQALSAEIQRLQAHCGSTADLLSDRRRSMWCNEGAARKAIEEKRIYKVTWRGADPIMCNIEEAAAQVKKKVTSLRTYLAKGNGIAHFNIEDELVTVLKKK